MKVTATRTFGFDTGHRVLGHQGKCRFPHGHRYTLDLTVRAESLDDLGMVIDFADIKKIVTEWIDEKLDHGFVVFNRDLDLIEALSSLRDYRLTIVPFNPTAENLAAWMYDQLDALLPVKVDVVKLWETPNCWVEAR